MTRAPRPSLAPLALLSLAALPAAAQERFRDPHSFSRPDDVAVTHLELDLMVDFAAKRIAGIAMLSVQRNDPAAEELLLDTRDLEIVSVRLDGSSEPVVFRQSDNVPFLGRSLTVPLDHETKKVRIEYRTSPNAAALQWLEPAQTAGGKQPFLFTQSQPILARTWVPCQDSPGVRATYTATVRVQPDLMALMSAENPKAKRPDGVYKFRMDKPIPSYLMALAVGDVEFRELGKRSGVYAEPSVVAGAAYELADTEAMIAAAEKLYGPYRWGRYDLLVLPPSFPYGGMENPRLTFATPTILAGDRSLVSLIAHELAHSWSGNLVTNATWNDFWLNEGFTTYFENRIMEAVYGAEHAAMERALARQEIDEALAALGRDTRKGWLYGELAGKDPDDYDAAVQYDKGALLLHTIESIVGRKRWDTYLKGYFQRHAFRSMTTPGFLDDLREHLIGDDMALNLRLDLESWIYGPTVPKNAVVTESAALAKVDHELGRLRAGALAADLETDGWVTQQWQRFLRGLEKSSKERLADLDAVFALNRSGNAEILNDWFQLAIAADYEPAYPALERFLTGMGRRKFLRPLYTELAKTSAGLARAKAIYAKARPGYHPVSRGTIDAIVGYKG